MSFPRYPTYKPSGVEWLGEVPEHWNRTALKFLADYQNGYPFKPEDRGTEGLPIIRISQLTGDDEPAYYSGDLDERVKVRDGDLLFTWSATIDSFIWDKGEAWLNQHIFRVSPSAEADKHYLYYVIKHVAPKLADFDAHGSTMRHIKKESLGEKVYVPSVRDQGLIATFLDHETTKIDALIAEQQRLIELLQEKRQSVISHAVSKGLNPDAPMKDSGVEWLGEVPEHWRNFRLKALFALKHGYAFDGRQFSEEGEYALMTPGNFIETGGFRRKDPEKYYVGSDMPSEFILQGGEMLIAMTEQAPGLVGTALIAPEGEHYLHNQRLGLVTRLKTEELDTSFLYWLMNSPVLKAKVGVTAAGQKVRHTSPQKILDNEICLPPLEEQKIIAQALFEANEKCIKLAENAYSSIRLLVERRSALISAAVTGQINVRGLVPVAEAA
jgi:type I restriction enzyme, S subunit